MHKICKQIVKAHITSCLFNKFWFHYFYILLLYEVFGKHKLGNSTIGQIGETMFITEFLIVANTLIFNMFEKRAKLGQLWQN